MNPLMAWIGSLTLDGSSEEGYGFKIVDWEETVSVRQERFERPAAHGDFDVPVYRGSRLIQASGYCTAESLPKLNWYRNAFLGLLGDGSSGRLTREMDGLATWSDVRLADEPTFDKHVFAPYAEWEFTLTAADPRKYGQERSFAADEAAFHYGNFPATPRIIVRGTAESGYTVTGPGGREVVVMRPLSPSAPHTLDFATGGLYVGGSRVMGAITTFQPWVIPPGTASVVATVNGSRTLEVLIADTFI